MVRPQRRIAHRRGVLCLLLAVAKVVGSISSISEGKANILPAISQPPSSRKGMATNGGFIPRRRQEAIAIDTMVIFGSKWCDGSIGLGRLHSAA